MFPLHISQSYRPHYCTDQSEGLRFWAAQEQIYNGGVALSFRRDTSGVCGVKSCGTAEMPQLSPLLCGLGT